MRIECQAIKLGIEIRGQPTVKQHGILEYVRSKRSKRPQQIKLKQIEVNGQSYYKSYSKTTV